MVPTDLRQFIALLDEAGMLARIEKPVGEAFSIITNVPGVDDVPDF